MNVVGGIKATLIIFYLGVHCESHWRAKLLKRMVYDKASPDTIVRSLQIDSRPWTTIARS